MMKRKTSTTETRRGTEQRCRSRRAGSLMPALALGVAVVLLGATLVIDRLWLDLAYAELQRTAEAAALAAGRELASDDLLRETADPSARLMKARWAAARIGAENRVAGDSVRIHTDDDVRFGQLVEVTGQTVFMDDQVAPTSVSVTARRTKGRQSAIWLALQTLWGPKSADVVANAEATLDNRVIGLRTVSDLPLPTLPVAIRWSGTSPKTGPANWQSDIEQQRGDDRFAYDSATGHVSESADGISEITLRTASSDESSRGNAHFVMLRDDLTDDDLRRQIREGWSAHDLKESSNALLLDRGPLMMTGLRGVNAGTLNDSLRSVAGQSRICLLYDRAESEPNSPVARLHCVGFVAGRVMSVRDVSGSECEFVFQPAVMTSRSAIVASEVRGSLSAAEAESVPRNRYLYKLRLTH